MKYICHQFHRAHHSSTAVQCNPILDTSSPVVGRRPSLARLGGWPPSLQLCVIAYRGLLICPYRGGSAATGTRKTTTIKRTERLSFLGVMVTQLRTLPETPRIPQHYGSTMTFIVPRGSSLSDRPKYFASSSCKQGGAEASLQTVNLKLLRTFIQRLMSLYLYLFISTFELRCIRYMFELLFND